MKTPSTDQNAPDLVDSLDGLKRWFAAMVLPDEPVNEAIVKHGLAQIDGLRGMAAMQARQIDIIFEQLTDEQLDRVVEALGGDAPGGLQ